jgi:hypothetical protein
MGSARIVLNTRTLRIGAQTYQLRNLARVQTLELRKPADADTGNGGMAKLAGAGVLVAGLLLACGVRSGALAFVTLLAAAAAAITVYQLTKKPYIPMYALMLETTGNPVTALVSPDRAELQRIGDLIVDAIESPPKQETSLQVSNVTFGDNTTRPG